jgi:hypothetical protein
LKIYLLNKIENNFIDYELKIITFNTY